MMYDYYIDQAVLNLLFKTESSQYLEIKRAVESALGRTISSETFSKHMKRILNQGWLNKEDSNLRGKPVLYSLLPAGRKRYSLALLARPDAKDYANLYSSLLYFEFKHHGVGSYAIQDDKELEEILYEQRSTLQDLKVDDEKTRTKSEDLEVSLVIYEEGNLEWFINEVVQIRQELLGDEHIPGDLKDLIRTIDNDKVNIEDEKLEALVRFVFRKTTSVLPSDKLSVIVYHPIAGIKITKWNWSYEPPIPFHEYHVELPGFSLSEIYEKEKSHFGVDSLEAIKEAINRLCDAGLLQRDITFKNEHRFVHSDYMLRVLLTDYHSILTKYWDLMSNHVWMQRSPTKVEKQWIRDFNSNGQKILDALALKRRKRMARRRTGTRQKKKDLKLRQEKMRGIFQQFIQKHIRILESYSWLHDILGITLPALYSEFRKVSTSTKKEQPMTIR